MRRQKDSQVLPLSERTSAYQVVNRSSIIRYHADIDARVVGRGVLELPLMPLDAAPIMQAMESHASRLSVDQVAQAVSSDPRLVLSLLLFSSTHLPAPFRVTKTGHSSDVLAIVKVKLDTLNNALAFFKEPPMSADQLLSDRPWPFSINCKKRSGSDFKISRHGTTGENAALRMGFFWIQARTDLTHELLEASFQMPARSVLDRLTAARLIIAAAEGSKHSSAFHDSTVLGHAEFVSALTQLSTGDRKDNMEPYKLATRFSDLRRKRKQLS